MKSRISIKNRFVHRIYNGPKALLDKAHEVKNLSVVESTIMNTRTNCEHFIRYPKQIQKTEPKFERILNQEKFDTRTRTGNIQTRINIRR